MSRCGCARCGCAATATWPLYALDPGELYVNVGFWSTVPLPARRRRRLPQPRDRGEVTELGGHKSLYSTAFYRRDEFWRRYNGDGVRRAEGDIRSGRPAARPVRQTVRGSERIEEVRRPMPLAEVFERVAGPDTAGRVQRLRRQQRPGRGLADVHGRRQVADRGRLPGSPHPASSAWPALRRPGTSRSTATCTRRWPLLAGAQRIDTSVGRAAAACCASSDPKLLLPRIAPPPQEVGVNRAVAGRACGTPRRATPRRSPTTTTCRTRSTSGCSARRWPTPARATRAPTRPWRRRRTHKYDLVARKLGLKPGMRLLDVGCGWGGMVMHAASTTASRRSA